MMQATVNLFADMGVQPGSLQAGLVATTQSTDTTPPSATIATPPDGSTVQIGLPVSISGTAVDTGGGVVGGVEVSVDGGTTWRRADGRANWSYSWTPDTAGAISVLSRAADDSANLGTATGITVNVSNNPDTTPPTVSVTSPTNGATVSGSVSVTADASDNFGVVGVQFQLDGVNLGLEDTAAPYDITWNTSDQRQRYLYIDSRCTRCCRQPDDVASGFRDGGQSHRHDAANGHDGQSDRWCHRRTVEQHGDCDL